MLERIVCAISSSDRYKNLGTDSLCPVLLQKGGELFWHRLFLLCRSNISEEVYWNHGWRSRWTWRTSQEGRERYDQAKAYSTLSLTWFAFKSLGRLVDFHFGEGFLSSRVIRPAKSTQQVGKSVDRALHDLVRALNRALDTERSTLFRNRMVMW